MCNTIGFFLFILFNLPGKAKYLLLGVGSSRPTIINIIMTKIKVWIEQKKLLLFKTIVFLFLFPHKSDTKINALNWPRC